MNLPVHDATGVQELQPARNVQHHTAAAAVPVQFAHAVPRQRLAQIST